MLHSADTLWSANRSDSLSSLSTYPLTRKRVVFHLPRKDWRTGPLEALLLVLHSWQQLVLGTGFTDAQRMPPPAIGAVVTYR